MTTAHQDHSLISSTEVKDAGVYDRSGNHIGNVDHLMIEKATGRVRYAVVSFGGFLGLGESHYPLPWMALTYDPDIGGYRTDVTERQLADAPQFSNDSWTRRGWEEQLHEHYRTPGYWDEKLVEGMSEAGAERQRSH